MARIVNPEWKKKIVERLDNGLELNEAVGPAISKKWLVKLLLERRVPYKITNAGCGVSIISTYTDVCPCCKRKL